MNWKEIDTKYFIKCYHQEHIFKDIRQIRKYLIKRLNNMYMPDTTRTKIYSIINKL